METTWAYNGLPIKTATATAMPDLIEMFLADCNLGGLAPATIQSYQRKLEALCNYSKYTGQVSRLQISGYFNYLHNERGLKNNTIANYHKTFCTFFNWVAKNHYGPSPMKNIPRPRRTRTLPKFLNETQVATLLESEERRRDFWGLRSAAIINVFLATGIRRAELCGLSLEDVGLIDLRLNIRAGKGQKDRIIPLDAEAVPALEKWFTARSHRFYNNNTPWVFPSRNGGRLSEKEVWEHIKNAGENIGVKLSPHMLRHTFATLYLANGGNIEALRQILGHTNIKTTNIYTHTSGRMIRADLLKVSPLRAARRKAAKAKYPADLTIPRF